MVWICFNNIEAPNSNECDKILLVPVIEGVVRFV